MKLLNIATLAIAFLCSGQVSAEQHASTKMLIQLNKSRQLEVTAIKNNDAVMMAEAAANTPLVSQKHAGLIQKQDTAHETTGRLEKRRTELSSTARKMAASQAEIMAKVEKILRRLPRTRGIFGNPGVLRHDDRANAIATDQFKLKFNGKEESIILLWSNANIPVELTVLDSSNKDVCTTSNYEGGGPSDRVCQFTPDSTNELTVSVKNPNQEASDYVLLFN